MPDSDEYPESALKPFLPSLASAKSWLEEITSPRPGAFGCRGDFFRFVLDTRLVTRHAERKGLKKGLILPFVFSGSVERTWGDQNYGQALGIDCRDGRVSFYAVCKRWGLSASSAVEGRGEMNAVLHREQGEIVRRFFRFFDGIQIVVEDGHLIFSGHSTKGEGRLQVRAMTDLHFFPSGTIFRGEFERNLADLTMAKLPLRSRFRTDAGEAELNGLVLAGTRPVEKMDKQFNGHLVSRAYNLSGDGGSTLSFSSEVDPLVFSWLDDDGVDCVLAC